MKISTVLHSIVRACPPRLWDCLGFRPTGLGPASAEIPKGRNNIFKLLMIGLCCVVGLLQATSIDFQSVPVSGIGAYTDPTPLFDQFGISVSNNTPGALFGVTESDATIPTLVHVLNQYNGTNPETYTLNFAVPVNDLTFVRQQYGINNSGPAWSASALDSSGNVLQTVSEGAQPPGGSPTKTFAFTVNNIQGLRVDANDVARATWSGPPISSMSYTPVPEPATIASFGIALGFLGVGGVMRRLRRRP